MLRRAWKAHGTEGFEFVILATLSTKAECDKAEADAISRHASVGLCYNVVPHACGPSGRSPETREKIRQANLRNGNRPPSNLGKTFSPESREKMRKACLARGARPPSPKGKKLSEEHKRKLLEGRAGVRPRLGMITPPETREKQRAAALRRIEREGPQPRRSDGPYAPRAKS